MNFIFGIIARIETKLNFIFDKVLNEFLANLKSMNMLRISTHPFGLNIAKYLYTEWKLKLVIILI